MPEPHFQNRLRSNQGFADEKRVSSLNATYPLPLLSASHKIPRHNVQNRLAETNYLRSSDFHCSSDSVLQEKMKECALKQAAGSVVFGGCKKGICKEVTGSLLI